VALENVKSYGTEGRELLDTSGNSAFVPPQDVVHAYLLFRGQDIKDLHVHEKAAEETLTNDAAGPPVEEKAAVEAPPKSNDRKQRKNNREGTGASLLGKNMRGGRGGKGKLVGDRCRFCHHGVLYFISI
jgi:hypothetical protein